MQDFAVGRTETVSQYGWILERVSLI